MNENVWTFRFRRLIQDTDTAEGMRGALKIQMNICKAWNAIKEENEKKKMSRKLSDSQAS